MRRSRGPSAKTAQLRLVENMVEVLRPQAHAEAAYRLRNANGKYR